MTGDEWYALHLAESKECGYIVTVGCTYCRTCNGAGGDIYSVAASNVCDDCKGFGEFVHEDWTGEDDDA